MNKEIETKEVENMSLHHLDVSITEKEGDKVNFELVTKEENEYIHKSKTEQMCEMIHRIAKSGSDYMNYLLNSNTMIFTHHANPESTKELARNLKFSLMKTLSNYKKMHGGKTKRHVHLRKYKLKNSSKAINVGNIEIINGKAVYIDIPKNNKRKTKKERRLSKQRNIRRKRGYGLHMERLYRRKLKHG